jgi:multicomponent Na+:H+ antiporter subunit F
MKSLRWFIGLAALIIIFLAIIFYPIPSLLEWQSLLLKRVFFILFLCSCFCLWRIFKGPTSSDRAAALDIFGILIVGFCAVLGIPTGRDWYIDIGIAWALQSFIFVLALAKHLEGKRLDE